MYFVAVHSYEHVMTHYLVRHDMYVYNHLQLLICYAYLLLLRYVSECVLHLSKCIVHLRYIIIRILYYDMYHYFLA